MISAKVKVDFDIRRVATALNVPVCKIMNKVAIDIFREIVRGTPVDTGRARASWNIAVNRIANREVAVRKGSKMSASEASRLSLNNARNGSAKNPKDVIFISNNVEYVYYLEFGTPKMSPAAMVANSIASARANFNRVLSAIDSGNFTPVP